MEIAGNEFGGASALSIITLVILGLFALRMLLLRRRNQVSILLPVGILAGILLLMRTGHWESRRHIASIPMTQSQERALRALEQVEVEDLLVAAPVPPARPRIETTSEGAMLKIPLSADTLEDYLGADGTTAWENISQAVPEEWRQAYFMVPVPVSGAESLPGLRTLASAIAQMTQDASTQVTANLTREITEAILMGPVAEQQAAETPRTTRRSPAWMSRLDKDPLVVTSGFEQSVEDADEQLSQSVAQALLDQAWKKVAGESSDERILEQRTFQLTSRAVDACIVERYSDDVALGVGDGPPMRRRSALINFPDEIQQRAAQHVRQSLQNERAWTVAAAGVSLSLVVMLAAGLLQLAGSRRRIARYVGVPIVGLLMLPGIAFSTSLVSDVVERDSADIPSPVRLGPTTIDYSA